MQENNTKTCGFFRRSAANTAASVEIFSLVSESDEVEGKRGEGGGGRKGGGGGTDY